MADATKTSTVRSHWRSRVGFVLAAAGSAVGLGNIWKFPYITGENGGGWFVLVYLVCIALIGVPIMMAEVLIGKTSQRSPVGAFRALSKPRSPWILSGWLGVLTAFVILSYYSVVAGWSLHYIWLSVSEGFNGQTPDQIGDTFGAVAGSTSISVGWHLAFMAITIAIVAAGIRNGIEVAAKVLMPTLFVLMLVMLVYAATRSGFGEAVAFVFQPSSKKFTGAGALEALGHSFFTLSLGMGAMITYGSYMQKSTDIVKASVTVSLLDTLVALMSCLILFPMLFTVGKDPAAGPGLVFASMPIAFSQMPGGTILAPVFFVLLAFAALTSAISLLEVAASYFIDEQGISRAVAVLGTGITIALLGIPSAMSNSTEIFGAQTAASTENFMQVFGKEGMNWLDFFDYLASNWMLPIGALLIALFAAWRVGDEARKQGFTEGSTWGNVYMIWLQVLRYVVPIAIVAVFLYASGILAKLGWV